MSERIGAPAQSPSQRIGVPVARLAPVPVVLDAVAASACPVKTRHAYEGGPGPDPAEPGAADSGSDPVRLERERERSAFVTGVLDAWVEAIPATDLRTVRDPRERAARTLAAMRSGSPLIIGPALPADPARHRSGSPEALLRSDQPGASRQPWPGRPGYHPVLVRWHRVLRRLPEVAETIIPERPRSARLDRPSVNDSEPLELGLRLESRIADFLQLAHHHRLLEAVGHAGRPWGAVIGTDGSGPDESRLTRPFLTWLELDRPVVRVVDHQRPEGWRLAPVLERADVELVTRVAIADAVRTGVPSPADVVRPVVVDECRGCRWWPACRAELDNDDLSLRIARGRLDRIEITALRSRSVETVADLAAADVETMLPSYLPDVSHRAGAESRLRAVARRARMLERGEPIERESTGAIDVPAAEVEIDLDIETSAAGRVYLWGFAVDEGDGPCYVEFTRFTDLDEAAERALADQALGWLHAVVEGRRTARVYHYSGFEVAMIESLAARAPDDEVLRWAAEYARNEFIDLLEIVQANFFGAVGLGLKQIAVAAGFAWRDVDPGGLNSQRWFDDAVHAAEPTDRETARRRVLAYNEDDVRATAHLRAWLRAQ